MRGESPVIALSSVRSEERERLKRLILDSRERLPAELDETPFGERCTHLVLAQPRRTLKALFAIARGAHIVSVPWVEASTREGAWAGEGSYELIGLPGAQRARAAVGDPPLFAHARVHVAPGTRAPRSALEQLLTLLGAAVEAEESARRTDVVLILGDDAPSPLPPTRRVLRENALLSAIERYERPAALGSPPPRGPAQPEAHAQSPAPSAEVSAPALDPDAPRWLQPASRAVASRVRLGKAAESEHAPQPKPQRTRVMPKRGASAQGPSSRAPVAPTACGAWGVGGGLSVRIVRGQGAHVADYFVMDDVLEIYRDRLPRCNVDYHARGGAHNVDAGSPEGADEHDEDDFAFTSDARSSKRRAHPRAAPAPSGAASKRAKRPVDFLGDLIGGGSAPSPRPARGSGAHSGRLTLALVLDDGGLPLAALTLHVHARLGVGEILLCAVRKQRSRRGLGGALVECTLEVLRDISGLHTAVCIASKDSVGFWEKMGFSADVSLGSDAWASLIDPFDDSVVMQLQLHNAEPHRPLATGTVRASSAG